MRRLWILLSMFASFAFSQVAWSAPITVQSFGGVCNGVANDTVALTSWAASATPYATLALYGNCVTMSPISFPNVDHVQITGKGAITYKGSANSVNIVTIGSTVTSPTHCSVNDWFITDVSIHSTTSMVSGDALRLNDMCASHFINVNVGHLLNPDGTLYNAIHFNGGNTIRFSGGGSSGTNVAMIVNGDPTEQFTDLTLECPLLLGSAIGLEIAGNAGGTNVTCGDILLNNVDVQIDQSMIAIPNTQVFLGPNLFLDLTNGGVNDNLYVTDPGGPNSLLFTSGTWIASARSSCVAFAPGVTWQVHMSGGTVYNCAAAGIWTNSANVKLDISGVLMDHINFYALNNPLAVVNKCAVTFGPSIAPAPIFGTVGSSC